MLLLCPKHIVIFPATVCIAVAIKFIFLDVPKLSMSFDNKQIHWVHCAPYIKYFKICNWFTIEKKFTIESFCSIWKSIFLFLFAWNSMVKHQNRIRKGTTTQLWKFLCEINNVFDEIMKLAVSSGILLYTVLQNSVTAEFTIKKQTVNSSLACL